MLEFQGMKWLEMAYNRYVMTGCGLKKETSRNESCRIYEIEKLVAEVKETSLIWSMNSLRLGQDICDANWVDKT